MGELVKIGAYAGEGGRKRGAEEEGRTGGCLWEEVVALRYAFSFVLQLLLERANIRHTSHNPRSREKAGRQAGRHFLCTNRLPTSLLL